MAAQSAALQREARLRSAAPSSDGRKQVYGSVAQKKERSGEFGSRTDDVHQGGGRRVKMICRSLCASAYKTDCFRFVFFFFFFWREAKILKLMWLRS